MAHRKPPPKNAHDQNELLLHAYKVELRQQAGALVPVDCYLSEGFKHVRQALAKLERRGMIQVTRGERRRIDAFCLTLDGREHAQRLRDLSAYEERTPKTHPHNATLRESYNHWKDRIMRDVTFVHRLGDALGDTLHQGYPMDVAHDADDAEFLREAAYRLYMLMTLTYIYEHQRQDPPTVGPTAIGGGEGGKGRVTVPVIDVDFP